jgi:glycosyltransferase involved in cell wall biosynthesis
VSLHVLVVTAMYPRATKPADGIFVAEQVEALRRAGVHVDVHVIDGRSGWLKYARSAFAVAVITQRKRYDLVHGHYAFAGLVARSQLRAPVVVTLHGSDANLRSQRPFARAAVALATRTIVVSPHLARLAGCPGANVIPCGVDLNRFKPMDRLEARRLLGLREDVPVVLFSSDPTRRVKRFDRFQAAIALLDRPVQVIALTNIDRQRVPVLLNAADCVVLTSDSEGSPVIVREALACNTPIVSVDVGDVRDQLSRVEPGEVVDTPSPRCVAAAIQKTLSTGARSNGRNRVRHLSHDAVAARVREVYDGVVTDKTRRLGKD